MSARAYKKYMKKDSGKDYTLLKLFTISFFGMLLVFTFIIKSFSPSVDVSIGDYKQEAIVDNSEEVKKNVDMRLAMIQEEDQGRNFSELMKKAEDEKNEKVELKKLTSSDPEENSETQVAETPALDPVYKVFIGSYTSAEQAKVAKDIIAESGMNLNPIVKCIGRQQEDFL